MSLTGVALVMTAQANPSLTVAKDGSGTYRTVQSAIDAAGPGDSITVAEGTYREVIDVPTSKEGLTIKGETGDAEDVVITYGNAAGATRPDGSAYGTAGSATATFSADDLTVTGVTVQNTFDRAAHPEVTRTQAVAVNARGDRQVFRNARFVGHHDTVLNWAPSETGQYRQYFRDCLISGDAGVVRGNATAVYDRVTITLRDRGAAAGGLNGILAAPHTSPAKPYGVLLTDSTVRSAAAASTFHLGSRLWQSTADATGQLVIRQTELPAAVKTSAPWTGMGGHPWLSARFFEYRNSGPGAGTGGQRPQLSDAQAADYTAQRYLAGTDGWNPVD
jgi:pectin methylesterase-like acyl-CoA thioesterase